MERIQTAFRLSKMSIDSLKSMRDELNENSAIRVSMGDIIEILIRQANTQNLKKKIRSLNNEL